MSDVNNPWDVNFSRTSFLLRLLNAHSNVTDVQRDRDIFFTFNRPKQGDKIHLLGCDEYVLSLALAQRALEDFGKIDIICVGGKWNGYSRQAKDFCLDRKIGLYNVGELNGALFSNAYWDYVQRDADGAAVSNIKR